jgi:opacity protein-like surface antigen
MKKVFIAAAICAAVSSSALAAGTSVTVGYQNQSVDDHSGPDQQQVSLQVKQKFTDLFSADFSLLPNQNDYFVDSSGKASSKSYRAGNRVDAGISAQKQIFGPVDGYARLGLGVKTVNGAQSFAYNSEELGVIYNTPFNVRARVGYRWRQAFSTTTAQNDSSTTVRMGLAYDLTKVDTIGVNYDKVNNDIGSGQTAYQLNYTRKF